MGANWISIQTNIKSLCSAKVCVSLWLGIWSNQGGQGLLPEKVIPELRSKNEYDQVTNLPAQMTAMSGTQTNNQTLHTHTRAAGAAIKETHADRISHRCVGLLLIITSWVVLSICQGWIEVPTWGEGPCVSFAA